MEIFSKNDILVKRLFDINGRLLKKMCFCVTLAFKYFIYVR